MWFFVCNNALTSPHTHTHVLSPFVLFVFISFKNGWIGGRRHFGAWKIAPGGNAHRLQTFPYSCSATLLCCPWQDDFGESEQFFEMFLLWWNFLWHLVMQQCYKDALKSNVSTWWQPQWWKKKTCGETLAISHSNLPQRLNIRMKSEVAFLGLSIPQI